jgi:anion-transporting  ArsA/GET3 family ATPase
MGEPMKLSDWLSRKVLICVGSGGVGKTSVSASIAVLAAKQGKRVLVMTIDPSLRLRQSLGLLKSDQGIVKVPLKNAPGELFATWLDAERIFQDFIESSTHNPDLGQKLLKNRLYQQLSTTLSGSQEFTSLLQLTKMVDQSDYDLVVLDTPPAQHAIDFLEAPEKLHALFHDSVVKWFVGQEQEFGLFRKLVARGTLTVFAALQKITGADFMVELHDFFKSVTAVQAKIIAKTTQVRELLRRPTTRFLLVTAFDTAKLQEATALRKYLKDESYGLDGILVNRAFPKWFQSTKDAGYKDFGPALTVAKHEWTKYFTDRQENHREFVRTWRQELSVLTLPDLGYDISGLDALEAMANEIFIAEERV